jgi:very-short-patch-repair endonuclease
VKLWDWFALRRASPQIGMRGREIFLGRCFSGYKFRRQPTLGDYYLDFFCEEAELNNELDTSQHGFPDELQTDAEREKIFVIVQRLLVANRVESSDTDSPAKRPSVQGAKLQ